MKELFVSSFMKGGELLLSSFIQFLHDHLAVPKFLDFVCRAGLQENLGKWRKTLSTIQTMLDDAEEKQHTDRAVKEWLDDLRDLAYDVDDIVDELTTEALTAENQARPSKNKWPMIGVQQSRGWVQSSPRATQHAVQVFEAFKPLASGGEHAPSPPNILLIQFSAW